MIVPSGPPVWRVDSAPHQLQRDSGPVMVDENHFRNPQFPLESLVHAVVICSPELNLAAEIDLVTDRNNLHKLRQGHVLLCPALLQLSAHLLQCILRPFHRVF